MFFYGSDYKETNSKRKKKHNLHFDFETLVPIKIIFLYNNIKILGKKIMLSFTYTSKDTLSASIINPAGPDRPRIPLFLLFPWWTLSISSLILITGEATLGSRLSRILLPVFVLRYKDIYIYVCIVITK